ncbi:MAG: phosphotransferase [Ruaniaceae bacterium]|nr:phosphotransferase [Ruaniaceae bacterium]
MKVSLKLAALATVAIPGLDVVATRPPQHATADFRYGGVLDSTGRHLVVQEPQHADADRALATERSFLSSLQNLSRRDALPFDVVEVLGAATNEHDYTAIVYEHLSGNDLDYDFLSPGPGVTRSLGRAISAIHELPFSVVLEPGLPMFDANACRDARLAEVDQAARTRKVPTSLLARWEAALDDVSRWKFAPAVVHGDLAPENVLTGNGQVISVLNWSNVHIGDPATDLAWLYSGAPESSLDTIEESYAIGRHERPDSHLSDRAMLYSELAVVRWLLHGVKIHSSEIVADAERMLTDLSLHVETAAPSVAPAANWEVSGTIRFDADPEAVTAAVAAETSDLARAATSPAAAGASADEAPESPQSPTASAPPVFG